MIQRWIHTACRRQTILVCHVDVTLWAALAGLSKFRCVVFTLGGVPLGAAKYHAVSLCQSHDCLSEHLPVDTPNARCGLGLVGPFLKAHFVHVVATAIPTPDGVVPLLKLHKANGTVALNGLPLAFIVL